MTPWHAVLAFAGTVIACGLAFKGSPKTNSASEASGDPPEVAMLERLGLSAVLAVGTAVLMFRWRLAWHYINGDEYVALPAADTGMLDALLFDLELPSLVFTWFRLASRGLGGIAFLRPMNLVLWGVFAVAVWQGFRIRFPRARWGAPLLAMVICLDPALLAEVCEVRVFGTLLASCGLAFWFSAEPLRARWPKAAALAFTALAAAGLDSPVAVPMVIGFAVGFRLQYPILGAWTGWMRPQTLADVLVRSALIYGASVTPMVVAAATSRVDGLGTQGIAWSGSWVMFGAVLVASRFLSPDHRPTAGVAAFGALVAAVAHSAGQVPRFELAWMTVLPFVIAVAVSVASRLETGGRAESPWSWAPALVLVLWLGFYRGRSFIGGPIETLLLLAVLGAVFVRRRRGQAFELLLVVGLGTWAGGRAVWVVAAEVNAFIDGFRAELRLVDGVHAALMRASGEHPEAPVMHVSPSDLIRFTIQDHPLLDRGLPVSRPYWELQVPPFNYHPPSCADEAPFVLLSSGVRDADEAIGVRGPGAPLRPALDGPCDHCEAFETVQSGSQSGSFTVWWCESTAIP